MFERCKSLEGFPFSNEEKKESKVKDINSNLYSNNNKNNTILENSIQFSSSIANLKLENQFENFGLNISKWKTCDCKNMSYMFSSCPSLKSLPNISNWDTKNVTDMNSIFAFCISLIYLPDISNWNIINVRNISNMFFCCKSLLSLPDISNGILVM